MGDRFIPSAKDKVVFATAIADPANPTQAELSAATALLTPGTYVTYGLKEMTGFETSPSDVEVPDAATTHIGKIPGKTSSGDASITFYDDDAGSNPVRTALAEGTNGYVVIMRYGQTTGRRASVYPVRVNSVNDSQTTADNSAAMFVASFSIKSQPYKNATIAA